MIFIASAAIILPLILLGGPEFIRDPWNDH